MNKLTVISQMNMVTVIAMKKIEKTISFITPPVLILALVIV